MKVWKYRLVWGMNVVQAPADVLWLTAANQGGFVTVWGLVDEASPKVEQCFYVAATGEDVPFDWECCNYVGTCAFQEGTLIAHVFALGEEKPRLLTKEGS